MNSSMEREIIKDMQAKGPKEEHNYTLRRYKALLSSHYVNYRWLDNRINRKKTKKNPALVTKLKRRQQQTGELIDEYENAIKHLESK